MEYVLLDMRWNMNLYNKKLHFDIKQLAAIHIDEKLHTVSTFHRLSEGDYKMAKQIAYMMDVGEDVIMDFESAWEEFKQWLPKNVVFIVWDSEIKHVIQQCNKQFQKKQIIADFVDLQMIQEYMMPEKLNKKSIESTMEVLGLTWDRSRMLSVLYCVQCTLRLYRKLWKEGMKHFDRQEWENILIYEEYVKLKQRAFFPEIASKSLREECGDKIKDFCFENRFQLRAKGTWFEIDANYAVWKFDLLNRGVDLLYIPKRFVKTPHYDMQIVTQENDIENILQKIFDKIISTEEGLKFGVGSADVENVLARLCARVCG